LQRVLRQGWQTAENEIQGGPRFIRRGRRKARVLKSVEELADLKEGEILVATPTSPSWAPAFREDKGCSY
jgi:pyruvate,water dikinase